MDFDSIESEEPQGEPPAEQAFASVPVEEPRLPSFDDMADEQPQQQAAPLPAWDDMEAERTMDASTSGAFTRGAVEAAVPATSGLAAGLIAGTAATKALTPAGAAVAGPWGAAGGLAAGLLTGVGVGFLTSMGQDKILDMMGLRSGEGNLSRLQQTTDEIAHPYAKAAGNIAVSLPMLRPGVGTMALGQRAIGGGIGGAAEAAADFWQTGHVDPVKVGMGAAAGAAFPFTNRVGDRFVQAGHQLGGGQPPLNVNTQGSPNGPMPPGQPGQQARGLPRPEAPVMEGEIIPPERAQAQRNPEAEFAAQQRDTFAEGDPMWNFWNEAAMDAERATGKGRQWVDQEASMGPAKDGEFTYVNEGDLSRSNDLTTTAAGIAADNSPAPRIAAAGNPVGAPMGQRMAARVNDAARDYRKLPAPRAEVPGEQSSPVVHNEGPAPDTMLALADEGAPMRGGHLREVPQELSPFQRNMAESLQYFDPSGQAPRQSAPPAAPQPTGITPQQRPTLRAPAGARAPAQPREQMQRRGVPQDVTAAVTEPERALVTKVNEALQKAGMNEVIARLQAMPPKQQVAAAMRLVEQMQKQGSGVTTTGEAKAPVARAQVAGGVQARSKADAARKQGVLDAYDQAVAKYPPSNKELPIPVAAKDKAVLIDRLTAMVQHADSLTGGAKYAPRVKPASYQIVQAARKVLAKPTPANIKAYRTAEEGLVKGDAQYARDVQDTAHIEGDIQRRPHLPDAAAEAQIEKTAPDTRGRIEFDDFQNPKGDESPRFVGEQNDLRNWVNGLSDESYNKLSSLHPDIELDINATHQPARLMEALMDDLAAAESKRPGKIELVPAEDQKGVKRPVKTREDLPDSESKVVERKMSAKEQAAQKEYLKAHEEKMKSFSEDDNALIRETNEELTERRGGISDPESMTNPADSPMWRKFLEDEGGAVKVPQWLQDFFNPKMPSPVKVFGAKIGADLRKMNQKIMLFTHDVINLIRNAPELSTHEKTALRTALENGRTANLPQKLHDITTTQIAFMEREYNAMYDAFRINAINNKLPGYKNLPERKNNAGPGFKKFLPRVQKGKHNWDATDENDPYFGGQTLGAHADTLQERSYMALQNNNGDRLVFTPDPVGGIVILKNGGRIPLKNVAWDGEIGEVLTFKRRGQADDWTVDHAGIDEIKLAAGKDPATGEWRVEYYDNPLLTYANAIIGLKQASAKQEQFLSIVENPYFQQISTRVKADAEAATPKLVESSLPNFKGVYMPEALAWALDDFHNSSIQFVGNGMQGLQVWKNKADNASTLLTKIFVSFAPPLQMMNLLDVWAGGRGYKWLPGTGGWTNLVRTLPEAVKEVRTIGPKYREMLENGANPAALSSLTHRAVEQIAKLTAEDIVKNLSKWDPIARLWGVSAKDVADKLYTVVNKPVWQFNDMLAMQAYLENKANGMSGKQAARRMHEHVPDYALPTTVLGSRPLKMAMSDRVVSLFGSWKYFLFKSWAAPLGRLVRAKSSPAERVDAAANLLVGTAIAGLGYTGLTELLRMATGSETVEFEPRGRSRIATAPFKVGSGSKGPEHLMQQAWTPSVPFQAVIGGASNKDWKGDPIIETRDYTEEPGRKVARTLAEGVDWLTRTLVSPWGTLSREAAKPNATPGSVAKKALLDLAIGGIREPSAGEQKRNAGLPKYLRRDERKRERRPQGIIERGTNWLLE